jgi:hypothetical protein
MVSLKRGARVTVRPGRGGAVGVGLLLGALMLGGCSSGGLFGSPSGTTSAPSTVATTTGTRQLPDGVGKVLSYAFDAARTAGLADLTTHDASGRMRAQVLYTDWKVCFMTPRPGTVPSSSRVDFGVVKLDESCPASDQGLVTATAGAAMPDLRGRSARYAHDVLGNRAGISYKTRSGGSALVLVDSNWQVCDQTPKPGQPYGGVPVTLVVAKYSDGGCPPA